jgi:hypothetical protein
MQGIYYLQLQYLFKFKYFYYIKYAFGQCTLLGNYYTPYVSRNTIQFCVCYTIFKLKTKFNKEKPRIDDENLSFKETRRWFLMLHRSM